MVVKLKGLLTQGVCLTWSKTVTIWEINCSHLKTQIVLLDWCLRRFPCSGSPHIWHTGQAYINVPFQSPCVKKREKYSSRNTSQAICFDFWQKQSELAIPEMNSYGIKIEVRLRCSLWFRIIVPVPSRFLFHLCRTVSCGKWRQMQLATMFGLSPLEPAELCLLWNLIRSPVWPSCFHRTTNNSVQMTPARFASDALPLLHLWPHPYPEWEALRGKLWHITITLPRSPALFALGFGAKKNIQPHVRAAPRW